ncbi:MAG: hypothetical protein RQ733_08685 [Methyloprofundus sp.]|nr:hypothetical protein [Methyloprofundus sp.]
MKKNNIKKGIFTALFLASPLVMAANDYPASDFQPKVLFQDTDYKHEDSSSAKSSSAPLGEKTKPDANYPAATFQPEVLYHDTEYKHKKADINSESITLAVWTEKVEEEAAEAATGAEAEFSMNPLFAIVVLGVAGFLYSKKSKGTTKTKASTESASGLTGVAKYLQSKTPKLSGVEKYLEANKPTPKSGVAKYVAQRIVEQKKAAANKTTGVEKYMRNQNRG